MSAQKLFGIVVGGTESCNGISIMSLYDLSLLHPSLRDLSITVSSSDLSHLQRLYAFKAGPELFFVR